MMIFLKLLLSSGLFFIAATVFIRNESLCYPPSKYVKPIHYDIMFTSLIEENIFYGEYNISINILNKTQNIYLQSKEICINNITLFTNIEKYHENDKDTVYKPTFNRSGDTINVVFGDDLSPGNYTLYIEYFGNADKSFKILKTEKKSTWIADPHFQIINSRQLISCWDKQYLLEATFSISIRCKLCTALSNMAFRNIELYTQTMIWIHFDTTPAMSPYLVTMIVSNDRYTINLDNKTPNIHIWCRIKTVMDIEFAESVAKHVTVTLEYYGYHSNNILNVTHASIPNFHDKGIIVLGLVLYRESDIIYNKKLYPVAHQIQVVQLVGHKVVQQWFYNLNNPFQTSWFNEAFTTLLATNTVNKIYIDFRIINLFVVQNQHNAFFLDGDYHMWNSNLQDDSLLKIRQSIRAPFILRMIEHTVTEELFWNSFRSYAFGNQSIEHFLEEIVAAVGTHNAGQIMKNWFIQTHCPIINIRNVWDTMSKVNVWIQYTDTEIDCLPVTFTTRASPDFNNFTHYMVCVKEDLKLSLALNENDWMIFNVQQIGYYRVNYDIVNWQRISNYLNFDDYTKIHVLNRAQIIDDAFHLMITGQLDSYIFWNIIEYLHREEDYIAWYPMFKALEYIFSTFSALEEKIEMIKERISAILEKVLIKLKYKEMYEKDELRNCLRQEAARWACFLGDFVCKKEANNKLKQHIRNPKTHRLLPWWKEWTYCKGLMITTKNKTTWQSVFDIGVHKSDTKFLKYLACPEDTDVIIYYLENKQYHSIKRDHQLDVNSFLHIITKHAKNPTILKYILGHFNEIKPKEINVIAALIIIINNVYFENLIQEILEKVRGILDANLVEVNNKEDLFKIHQIKEMSDIMINKNDLYHHIKRQLMNRDNQTKRQRQYFVIFFE